MEKRARRMMSAAVHTVYTNGIFFGMRSINAVFPERYAVFCMYRKCG